MIKKVLHKLIGVPIFKPVLKKHLVPIYRKIKLVLKGEKSLSIKKWQDIPVIINNRNRYSFLIELISWLEKVGVKNIYILDNDSTYPPLIDYYKKTTHKVLYLKKNIGKTALWDSEHFDLFKHNYFIYTDPDVVPDEDCPENVIDFLWKKKRQYYWADKIGIGLKIDDIPDHFNLKTQVVEWEKQFWDNKLDNDLYKAAVDTTFALYEPYTWHNESTGLRTDAPYLLRHLPWYLDYSDLSDEERFYINTATKSSTIGLCINNENTYPNTLK